MPTYQLEIDKRVHKDLVDLPTSVQDRVLEKLETLLTDPFAPGTKKLQGYDSYRVRVGEYRIVFDIDTQARVVTVLAVDHRSNVYKRL